MEERKIFFDETPAGVCVQASLSGQSLRPSEEILALSSASPDQQTEAFDELGTGLLKPVFDKLNGALNYDELKILRICYLSREE